MTLDFLDDPYPTYRTWREAGPIQWRDDFFGGAWVLTRHADVEAALRDPHLSAQRTGGWVMDTTDTAEERRTLAPLQRLFARAMLFRDPPDHQRLRQVMQPAFRPERLAALQPEVALMVERLIDAVPTEGEFDFMAHMARALPAQVVARLMGLDADLQDNFLLWCEDLAAFIGAAQPTLEQARTAQRSLLDMAAYFERDLLPRRLREPADDWVTLLAQAQADGRIEAGAELVAQCAMLLFAGYETTRNLLGNGMLSLLKHRDQWQRLCEQPDLAAPAVRELLRFDSPVQWTGRRAATDVELAGQPVRRGQLVLALIGSANRDPERHPDPDALDITRSNVGALSFGSGPHVCIGAALTQLEAQAVFKALAQRCVHWQLAAPPQRNGNPVYRGLHALRLRA